MSRFMSWCCVREERDKVDREGGDVMGTKEDRDLGREEEGHVMDGRATGARSTGGER